ncbi:hypothetical protein SGLAM104S_01157 [Streptomyces glaucescens]
MDGLDRAVPRGAGPGGVWRPGPGELDRILEGGARYAVARGYGEERDLVRCEDGGAVDDAEVREVGERARERGLGQVGSLGSANHFLEVQQVSDVYDEPAAEAFGLTVGQVCVMIHCGSRGLGHQICTDHVRAMDRAMARYRITVPDRQLACTPVDSPEGRAYLGAMAAAANYGRANRQLLAYAAREVFRRAAGVHLSLVYDVSHNLAKLETHPVDGRPRRLCVHRKGATRAFPPGHPDLPADLREAGQPVLIPGTMGTASYVLAGVAGGDAFASTCHGAGLPDEPPPGGPHGHRPGAAGPPGTRGHRGAAPLLARPVRGDPGGVQGRRRGGGRERGRGAVPDRGPAGAAGRGEGLNRRAARTPTATAPLTRRSSPRTTSRTRPAGCAARARRRPWAPPR